jgi:type VI secretion system protein VasG
MNLRSLIGKLNGTCKSALEDAAGLCLSRTHYDVEIEHLLKKLLGADGTDLQRVIKHYGINRASFERDLDRSLDALKTGNARTPALSPHLVDLLQNAWLQASIEFSAGKVRSGHVLLALIGDPDLARIARSISRDLEQISADDLRKNLPDLVSGSREDAEDATVGSGPSGSPGASGPHPSGKTPSLDQYTVNLTQRAREGAIDPVLGRDSEIRQMVDILTRRRQNNPILTGEPGVGKTAVVEGLALRIAAGDVPPSLLNVALHSLDLGLLQAGASVKGEFENRLRSVIDEVKGSPQPIIVFIDEAHTLIGAGGQAGQNDAANLLKPALARGEMRTIAATTWSEYKKYFEKDAALARRFQVVKVEEPTEEAAIVMLRGIVAKMEEHHNVRILDDAVQQAVRLSHRYLVGRQLPDKAVSVLDTACARIGIGQSSTPAPLEDVRRRLEAIEAESRALAREQSTGAGHDEKLAELEGEAASLRAAQEGLEAKWAAEKAAVEELLKAEAALQQPELTAEDKIRLQSEFKSRKAALRQIQGDEPLVQAFVDEDTTGMVISAWTGVPVGKMLRDEIGTVLKLRELLEERVIGQSHALDEIARRIRTARANLEDPGKPKGVFLLVGTSGVGKTETALALADILYGGERNIVTINMSEYQEAHTVSSLRGSPPGYVGFGEGGVLTEAVRRRPYSVVLLDEVEKAHPDVLEIFFQVFDKGVMEDGEGREIDFKNTIILLTSNVGTDTIMRECRATDGNPDPEDLVKTLRPDLQSAFQPAFLGRLSVVPYYPIKDDVLRRIVELKLNKVKARVRENHGAQFSYSDRLVEEISRRCTEVDSGARNIDYILTGSVLPQIAEEVLTRMGEGAGFSEIAVDVSESGTFNFSLS